MSTSSFFRRLLCIAFLRKVSNASVDKSLTETLGIGTPSQVLPCLRSKNSDKPFPVNSMVVEPLRQGKSTYFILRKIV